MISNVERWLNWAITVATAVLAAVTAIGGLGS